MPNPSAEWDLVPIYGIYAEGTVGTVEATLAHRVLRADGWKIYPQGAKVTRVIGVHDEDAAIRNQVRAAKRAADEIAQGAAFDGAAWDLKWEADMATAVFFGFPATDDPEILPADPPYTVLIDEKLNAGGGKQYAVTPLLSHLDLTPPGINLGTIIVSSDAPSNPPAMYAKNIPLGIAGINAAGFVEDANGNVLDPDLLGGDGTGGAPVEQTVDALGTDKLETAPEIVKTYDSTAKVITLALGPTVESVSGAQNKADAAKARSTHTGTQSADTLTDGATNKVFVAAEKTKLAGIATGATANAADSALRDRSTHTGTQPATTVAVSATSRLIGRSTAGAGAAEELTATQAKMLLALNNVDNTADTAKPISAAQQAALDAKADDADLIDVQAAPSGGLVATAANGVLNLSIDAFGVDPSIHIGPGTIGADRLAAGAGSVPTAIQVVTDNLTISNTATQTSLATFTPAAGVLAAGDVVTMAIWGDMQNNSGAAANWAFRFLQNGVNQFQTLNTSFDANSSYRKWRMETTLVVTSATAQEFEGLLSISEPGTGATFRTVPATLQWIGNNAPSGTDVVAAAVPMVFAVQHGTAHASVLTRMLGGYMVHNRAAR